MDKEVKKILKGMLSKVNATLKFYEANWISAQRTPEIEKTRVTSFEEYVEIRVNYEAFKIPEFRDAVRLSEGHLFVCNALTNINDIRHKFRQAYITFTDPDILFADVEENQEIKTELKSEIQRIQELIGGNVIRFNSVETKIKIIVEYE